jgi:hypothetical protein
LRIVTLEEHFPWRRRGYRLCPRLHGFPHRRRYVGHHNPEPPVATIAAGERVGIVGESGCGKTVTGLSLLRLLPAHSARLSGRMLSRVSAYETKPAS